MQDGTIGRRYARALNLSLAGASADQLGMIEDQLSSLSSLLDRRNGHPVFRQAMLNPSFSAPQRRAVLMDVAKSHQCHEVVGKFLELLVDKDRVPQLPSIARAFRSEVDERLGRVRATISTARPLDAAALATIVAGLEKKTGKKVVAEVKVDPSLIAGVRAQIGGLVYDATVHSQLARLRSEFNVQ
jgi:F-type H+-transporting ATPase subunit delta